MKNRPPKFIVNGVLSPARFFSSSYINLANKQLLFLLILFITSCNAKLNHENYIKWVRDYDNKAHVKLARTDFVFDLQYQPAEYVLLQRGIENYPAESRIQELKELCEVQYYTLTISTKDNVDLIRYGTNNSVSEKEERQYYFSYRFQNDIALEEDGKTLPCILYHAERPATPGGGRTFVLGFENPNKKSVSSNIVIMPGLFGLSPVKIEVTKSNIPLVDL